MRLSKFRMNRPYHLDIDRDSPFVQILYFFCLVPTRNISMRMYTNEWQRERKIIVRRKVNDGFMFTCHVEGLLDRKIN